MGRLKYATNRPIGCDGLNDNERAVLALWDEGIGVNRIVERTGLSRAFVLQVTGEFSVTALVEWKAGVIAGSAALAAAIHRHHPQLCGAAS
jgi:hypothetical protein